MALIDGVVDSINSPETTNSPIPQAILHANAIVAYQFGNQWPTLSPYSQARPELAIRGWIISTTLTSNGPSRCYDIEPGGGHNANIGAFMRQADTRWGKPILYTFASNVHDMIVAAANQGYGRSDYYIYAAHPDSHYGRHICGPGVCPYPLADACQYTFQTPENCDTGIFQSYVLPGAAPIPPPAGGETMATTAYTLGSVRTILTADKVGNLYQTWQDLDVGQAWHGGEAGKHVAEFSYLAAGKGPVRSLASSVANGVAEVTVELQDGSYWDLWQHQDDRSWSGGETGLRIAALRSFAASVD